MYTNNNQSAVAKVLWQWLCFLSKVSYDQVSVPKWLRVEDMHPVDYYATFTKNCSGHFTEEEIRNIRAYYYAMCAETDSMLGEQPLVCWSVVLSLGLM